MQGCRGHILNWRADVVAKCEPESKSSHEVRDAAQRVVVRIAAAITDDLVASAAYSGFLSVPGIADQPIPIIVRRTA